MSFCRPMPHHNSANFRLLYHGSISCKYIYRHLMSFVPKHSPVCENEVKQLTDFIRSSDQLFVLTGAGISTESGIPDYRSEGVGLYARSLKRPVQYQEFIRRPDIQRRYWARNYVGWPQFSSVLPNATHKAIRDLESQYEKLGCLVTQNVDSLHYKAGSQNVIELHGTAFTVVCLGCKRKMSRKDFQPILSAFNPSMKQESETIRPDGDVELSKEQMDTFVVPGCEYCGGLLKPDIVFFGDNVPMERLETVRRNLAECDSLLVLGSSLTVFSGYRIVLQAYDLFKSIAIVNIGETRGDDYADLKISTKCGDLLAKAVANLQNKQ